jgi:hypothetical protein
MPFSEDSATEPRPSDTDCERVAYADESARARDRLYVVAAAVIAQKHSDTVLDAVRHVPPGRSKRFHWRLEREESRMKMLAIAGAVATAFGDGIDRYLDHLGDDRPHVFDVDP